MTTRYTSSNVYVIAEKESSLVKAAQMGDVQAFNELVLSYQDRIYNLAARILGDKDTASDITQNTFLTAYLNLSRFRNGSFRSWLYKIATNACYDVYRTQKRHPMISYEDKEQTDEELSLLDDFSKSSTTPERELERRELEYVVQNALKQLDLDQRSVVIMADMQDFDYKEIAAIFGIPIGTVKSRLARARIHLRQLLSQAIAG